MFTSSNQEKNAPIPYSTPIASFWHFEKLQRVLMHAITPFVQPKTFSELFKQANNLVRSIFKCINIWELYIYVKYVMWVKL